MFDGKVMFDVKRHVVKQDTEKMLTVKYPPGFE